MWPWEAQGNGGAEEAGHEKQGKHTWASFSSLIGIPIVLVMMSCACLEYPKLFDSLRAVQDLGKKLSSSWAI